MYSEESVKAAWIVDDDEEMSHAVKLMLQLLEFEVSTFPNARSAGQALLAGRRPDLLVLDINMPEVTGIDFLEFVRSRAEFKHLPVVMLSTETADQQVDEALRLGANEFVFKPVTIEELERAVGNVLSQA
ncbi:MAG TPA: response regulator [Anaerolineales bacterium]|nr:response regulator [Anaerolineales bacterium]